ncbi:MAG: glycosyltransferase family 4 protein [Bacteroidaceae bacterium]|nr:glycosyltransferase family 4 protein [Bacteroidaceae bacterium]
MSKKIVYIVGGVYGVSGMNQVLTQKLNWLARHTDYEMHMVLTERPELPWALPVEPSVRWVNFGINFDELDTMPLIKKLWHYRRKQRQYKRAMTRYLMDLRADIVVSGCRREVNFIHDIPDGSHKIGEIHFDRSFYRQFSKPFLPKAVCRFISRRWIASFIREVNRFERFVVLTDEDLKHWPEVKRKMVIPNPLKQIPEGSSTCEEKRVVACTRYSWEKGVDLLMEAWRFVRERHPDWTLDIYGGGERHAYERLAEELGISDTVNCHGATRAIYDEYLGSSVLVLSSRYEGFGLVLIEAMSCGVPTVSFDTAGAKAIITDGSDGFLVRNGDTRALADRVCYLIEHPEERRRMGAKGIETSKKYTADNVMVRWLELFKEIL